MRAILSIITGTAMLGIASGLGAQERRPAPPKQPLPLRAPAPPECIRDGDNVECRMVRFGGDSTFQRLRRTSIDSALMKRPALGLQLSATGSLRDTLGVFVSRVTPKGPAENAGIVEGDRIVSINGVDLKVNAADAGDSYASGLPSRRLTREVAKLSPGNVVSLRVWSGGRIRDVRVTAGRASDLRERGSFGYLFDGPGFMMGDMPAMERMRMPLMRLREGMPLLRMEHGEHPGMLREHLEHLEESKKTKKK